MKVCVTGVAGLIGSWIAERLIQEGHEVVGIDNMIGGYRDSVPDGVVMLDADITNVNAIPGIARFIKGCEAVYHCAALAHEGFSVFSPASITNSVMTGTTAVATAAIKAGVKRFINCSSMSRYGDMPSPLYETTPPKPVDPYALAKVAAEQQLNLLGKLHGMHVIHTIPHNVIGPRQRYTDPFRNVVAIMINLILQDRPVVVYGDGTQVRCFSMIQDDVEIYLKLLDHECEHGEMFNIGPDDEPIAIKDLALLVADVLDKSVVIDWQPARPYEVHTSLCSSNKIRKVFNFKPKMTLRDGITSMAEYIKGRGVLPFDYHVPLEIDNKPNVPRTWKEKLF